jgi:hypothetical protein
MHSLSHIIGDIKNLAPHTRQRMSADKALFLMIAPPNGT